MRNSFYLYNAKQKTGKEKLVKRRQEFNLSNPDCTTNKKLKLDTTKQAEKAQNHHPQVLAEAYSTKRLSVQNESTEKTKSRQEEPIALDAVQPAEPIHVDEYSTVSRKLHGKRKTLESKNHMARERHHHLRRSLWEHFINFSNVCRLQSIDYINIAVHS